jgi:hypothetical protein
MVVSADKFIVEWAPMCYFAVVKIGSVLDLVRYVGRKNKRDKSLLDKKLLVITASLSHPCQAEMKDLVRWIACYGPSEKNESTVQCKVHL